MSIVAAELAGFAFQLAGTGMFVTLGVNLFGFLVLLLTAVVMNFLKRDPSTKSYGIRDMTRSDISVTK